jgi:hypothetical protein
LYTHWLSSAHGEDGSSEFRLTTPTPRLPPRTLDGTRQCWSLASRRSANPPAHRHQNHTPVLLSRRTEVHRRYTDDAPRGPQPISLIPEMISLDLKNMRGRKKQSVNQGPGTSLVARVLFSRIFVQERRSPMLRDMLVFRQSGPDRLVLKPSETFKGKCPRSSTSLD